MCFMLYAGRLRPIPRNEWNEGAPDIWVRPLLENESPVMAHFTLPEIQYIGSSSGCGCDFPHLMFQNGGWPSTLNMSVMSSMSKFAIQIARQSTDFCAAWTRMLLSSTVFGPAMNPRSRWRKNECSSTEFFTPRFP